MDVTYGITEQARPEITAAPTASRSSDTHGFSQSIQDAAGQAGGLRAAQNTQSPREPAYDDPRARAGVLVTPLTADELGIRQTMRELRSRQLLNLIAGHLTAPANIASYPQAGVSYAGYLAAQVNHAGFALPDSPARALSTPRRGLGVRTVEPVGDQKLEVRGQRLETSGNM